MRALAATLVLLALLVPAAPARADGDPASDILIYQDVFRPYAPKLTPAVARALDATARDAKAAGFPVKVALIQEGSDLGAYPMLFGDPQRYADLLGVEISFNEKPHILTVMPSGFGGKNLGPAATAALARIPIERAALSDGLALAAARGIAAVAAANGHPFALGALPPAQTRRAMPRASESGGALLYLAPVLLLALAGAFLALRGRRTGE